MNSNSVSPVSRRKFIKASSVATTAVLAGAASQDVLGASERIILGLIGPGGMGTNLLRSFLTLPNTSIAYVCDVDERRMNAAAEEVEKASGKRPKAVKDMRRIFEDKAVDAVVIATPDHWHAPATILACEAGKHVYVEKPCSHNLREGRLMIEAARRAKRVVQVGTQSRSTEHVQKAAELLRSGAIGDVLVAKAWNSQRRSSIGLAEPSQPPAELDYELWVGPAPIVPYQSNLLHGIWRWWHAFGTGDMGNDGVHDIDIARWGLGVETHPDTIAALGGKYFFEDDQQFPDTQYVLFEYGRGPKRKQLIFEQRIWSPYVQEGHENGNAFYGTKGMLVLGKSSGWKWFGERNELREEAKGSPDSGAHHRNFLECIKTGARPNADIEIGHHSTALCHLGNIATRIRRTLTFNPDKETFENDSEATPLLKREYRHGHWAVPKGV